MDGSPSRGETIPIRLFLGGFDLTPTFREVNKKYSTRYYLSLVLIDEGTLHPNPSVLPFQSTALPSEEDRSSSLVTDRFPAPTSAPLVFLQPRRSAWVGA